MKADLTLHIQIHFLMATDLQNKKRPTETLKFKCFGSFKIVFTKDTLKTASHLHYVHSYASIEPQTPSPIFCPICPGLLMSKLAVFPERIQEVSRLLRDLLFLSQSQQQNEGQRKRK